MLVHSLMDAFVRQSRAFAASRPSDNSLAPSAQPPLAWFACNDRPLTAKDILARPGTPAIARSSPSIFQYLLPPPPLWIPQWTAVELCT